MRFKKILLIVVFINNPVWGQGESVTKFDSLLTVLNLYKVQDTTKSNLLNKIAFGYYTRDQNMGIEFAEKGIDLANTLNKPKLLADAYFAMGANLYAKSKYEEALEYYDKAFTLYHKQADLNGKAFCYEFIAAIYHRKSDMKQALNYCNKSMVLFKKTGNQSGQANIFSIYGNINVNDADYPKAFENFNIAQETYQKTNDLEKLAITLHKIGAVHSLLSDYPLALSYFLKALAINQKLGNQMWMAHHYDNIGWVYYKTNKFDEAIKYYEKAIEINRSLGNERFYTTNCNHIGLVYKDVGNFQKALDYFQIARASSELRGEKNYLSISLYNIASIYLNAPDEILRKNKIDPSTKHVRAIEILNRTMEIATEINAKGILNMSLKEKGFAYEEMGNYRSSLENYKKYYAMKDRIEGDEIKREIARKELQFEYEKKEVILKGKQQLEIQRVEKEKIFLFFCILAVALISLVIYLWQRQKNLQQQKINSRNFTKQLLENTEEERKRIAGDLHDSISHELLNLKSIFTENLSVVNTKIDAIINDIRAISRNLHPIMFDKIGLVPNIQQLVERVQNQDNFLVSTDIDYKGSLTSGNELQIYRIIQEGLTNIIKYAKAHAAKVTIKEDIAKILIEIKDNGKGFNVQETLNSGKAFGLHNIIERSRVIGGEARISSSREGTMINICLPKKS